MKRQLVQKGGSQTLKAILGIRDLVYSGDVAGGERLSEVVVSERLGLSRTPVRAAFARLEQEGLLEAIPSGGYAVRIFSQADVVDAIELRGVMEGTAARLAAERGAAPEKLAELEELLSDLDMIIGVSPQKVDFAAYVEKNATFHQILADLPESSVIRREIDRIVRLPFAGHSAFLDALDIPAFRASLIVAQSHHKAIVDAIEKRQGARAEAIAREHARLAKSNLDAVMANRALIDSVPGLRLVSLASHAGGGHSTPR